MKQINVKVHNYYGKMILELSENDRVIYINTLPDYYSYKFQVDQLNGLVIVEEDSIKEIEKVAEISSISTFAYYGSMEPGISLTEDERIKIYSDESNSLKNLLAYLNDAKEKIKKSKIYR